MCGHHSSCYLLRFCFLILSFMEIDSDDSFYFPASTKTKRLVVFLNNHQITFNFCPNKGNSASLSPKREIPYWKTIKAPRFDDSQCVTSWWSIVNEGQHQAAGCWSHSKWEKHNNGVFACKVKSWLFTTNQLSKTWDVSERTSAAFQTKWIFNHSLNKDSWPHGSCCGGCRAPQTPRPGRGLPAPLPFSSSSSLSLTSSKSN